MKHRLAMPILRGIVGAVALAAAVGVILLPAYWLRWEADHAREQAKMMTDMEMLRIQHDMRDLIDRFERATGWIRVQDVTGDPVPLTGRLLRAEPLIAPASGLTILNQRGIQVASSLVSPGPANGSSTWFRSQSLPPSGQIAMLGCGIGGPGPSNWLLVKSFEGTQDTPVGVVVTMLPDTALRSLVFSAGSSLASAGITLRIIDGCELVRRDPAPISWQTGSPLLRALMHYLPSNWISNGPVVSMGKVGNVVISVTVKPEAFLALHGSELDMRAGTVTMAAGSFAAFLLLLGMAAVTRRKPSTPLVEHAQPKPARDDAAAAMMERETTRRELDEIVVERDRILAAIGHDVRTPMNSILGICALLMDGDLNELQRKWLQRIRASCEALLAMLNGILEIAAARVDGAEIHLEPIDVASLVEEVGDVLRPQAEDKGLELNVLLDENMLGLWRTDPTRLRQVLFNLCGNAIKYTVHGSVELAASAKPGKDGSSLLHLRVTDTGMGIAEDEREHIFGQFKRGRDEVSRGQEGLGLGLALCREIAALLSGTLSLESTVGVGSIFSFAIPVQHAESPQEKGGPLAGRSALVVGLSEGVRRRVASHLESVGLEVDTAGDGFLALGLAERMAYRHGALDLMVLDAALTGLSAEALLTRLQASRSLKRLRIVLVTNGSLTAPIEGRADAIVSHPVETRELEAVVAGLFGDRSILQEVYPRAPSTPCSRVLVVEDNRINQALFLDQLTRAGFSAFAASNGREAIEAVARGGFDAVLMDMQMPEVDGVEATRKIRATEEVGHRIPIIGMTAHNGAVIRKTCLEAGMDLVLHKPVDFAALPLRLHEVIGAARAHVGATLASEQLPPMDGNLDVDRESLQVLVAEVGVDRAAVCVSAFLGETGPHVTELGEHLGARCWEELQRLAHSLAGLGSTLGAMAFADGLLMLEDAARAKDAEKAAGAVREVSATWERTRLSLRAQFDEVCSGSIRPPKRAA